jgi:hypothetical protein
LQRIDLTEIQDVTLHDSPIGQTFVLADTEVAMLFAVFLAEIARKNIAAIMPIP